MRAFIIDRYGKKETGRIAEVPQPQLQDDDILIQIHAASVNVLDAKIRSGEFKLVLPYRLPLIPGNDLAGTVVRVGSRVQRFKPGDEVYARPDQDRIGTFAEFIAVKEASLALKPKNLTMEEAASVPLVGLTAWQVLIETAKTKERAEGTDPCRIRRCQHHRLPVRQASRGLRRHDYLRRYFTLTMTLPFARPVST